MLAFRKPADCNTADEQALETFFRQIESPDQEDDKSNTAVH
jgi:hypothetical protein